METSICSQFHHNLAHTLTQSSPVSFLHIWPCWRLRFSWAWEDNWWKFKIQETAALLLTFIITKSHTHTHTHTPTPPHTYTPHTQSSGNPPVFKDGVSCTDSNVDVNWMWQVHKYGWMNWWSCIVGDPATAGHGEQGHPTVHDGAGCCCWEWCTHIHTVCIHTYWNSRWDLSISIFLTAWKRYTLIFKNNVTNPLPQTHYCFK